MQTRDQRYACDAYTRVGKVKDQPFWKSYGSMAHKLPILIHTSGLAQALTFVVAGGKEGPKELLNDVARTVLNSDTETKEELLRLARGEQASQGNELLAYIWLTRSVLAALLWYKRYAQAILNVEAGDDPDELAEGGTSL